MEILNGTSNLLFQDIMNLGTCAHFHLLVDFSSFLLIFITMIDMKHCRDTTDSLVETKNLKI
jgi:hypothetical protein